MGDKFEQKQEYTYVSGLGFISQTPQQYERRKLMIQYNLLIFSIILLCMLRNTLVWPLVKFVSFLGFDVNISATNTVHMSQSAAQMVNLIMIIIYMLVPALILMHFNKRSDCVTSFMSEPKKYTTRFGVFIIVGVSIVAQFMVFVLRKSFDFVGIIFSIRPLEPPSEFGAFVIFVLFMTIVPAFLEEFLFRGIMITSLKFFGNVIAIVVPAIMYTLIQPTFDTMVYAFIMGLTLGFFTVKSGSIIVPIIGNFMSKGLILLISLENSNAFEVGYSSFKYGINIVFLILAAISFILFIMKDNSAFKIFSQETYLTNRTKIKYLFSSFGFWCLLGIAFFTATSYVQIIG